MSIDGTKKLFAERSNEMEVFLICPWSEVEPSGETLINSWQTLSITSIIIAVYQNVYTAL